MNKQLSENHQHQKRNFSISLANQNTTGTLPCTEWLVSGSFRHPQNAEGRMLMRQDFQKGTERGGEKLKTPTNLPVSHNDLSRR